MLKLIAFVWSGCWHKWKEDERRGAILHGYQSGIVSFCHCERCGVRKRFRMS